MTDEESLRMRNLGLHAMSFGAHKGEMLKDIDTAYLLWLTNLKERDNEYSGTLESKMKARLYFWYKVKRARELPALGG